LTTYLQKFVTFSYKQLKLQATEAKHSGKTILLSRRCPLVVYSTFSCKILHPSLHLHHPLLMLFLISALQPRTPFLLAGENFVEDVSWPVKKHPSIDILFRVIHSDHSNVEIEKSFKSYFTPYQYRSAQDVMKSPRLSIPTQTLSAPDWFLFWNANHMNILILVGTLHFHRRFIRLVTTLSMQHLSVH
jgi:hypothetical protein